MTEKITRERIEARKAFFEKAGDSPELAFEVALCTLALQAEENHSTISALQAEIKTWKETAARLRLELDAEQIAHSQCRTEKNNLVLKAYPAMDERDASAALIRDLQQQLKTAREDALEEAAQVAERDVDWSAFGKAAIEPWEKGQDSLRDYRLGIVSGRAIAAAIRSLGEKK